MSTIVRVTSLRILSALGAAAIVVGPPAAAPMDDHLFVVTSHHQDGGNRARMEIGRPWASITGLEPVGRDPVARHFFGRHYVVNRDTGTIQVIDPVTFETIRTLQIGPTSNPQDIVVVDLRTAYVSRYDSCFLYRIDLETGRGEDAVDLCPLADADGLPEMSMMALDGRHLFVQLQRLDRGLDLTPVRPSILAVVDVGTGALVDTDPQRPGVQGIELAGLIPSFKMQVEPLARRLYVSTPGVTLDGAGGIDTIDLDRLVRLGYVTSERIIGPDVSRFVMATPDKGYRLSHTDLTLSSHQTAFSRADGSHLAELYVSFDMVTGLEIDRPTAQVFFGDISGEGVRVFDVATDTMLTPAPIPSGAPPVDIVLARAITPGQSTALTVEGFDAATGGMTVSYRPACGAPDHEILYGPLQRVGRYEYTGKVCSIGGTGLHAGFDPGPGSYFFLIAGHDARGVDGLYGTDSSGRERPSYPGDPVCPYRQDFRRRCDR